MKIKYLTVGVAMLIASCTAPLPSLQSPNSSGSAYLHEAEALLRQACPKFNDTDLQVQVLPTNEGQPSESGRREFGWTKSATFSFVVMNQPSGVANAISNECSYEIGIEPKPSMITSKKVCVQICTGDKKPDAYLATQI